MNKSKIIIPLLIASAVVTHARKDKLLTFSKNILNVNRITSKKKNNLAEETFGGLTQKIVDKVVSNTYRGLKAVINEGSLEYWYTSASGKSKYIAQLTIDSLGKIHVEMVKSHPEATGSPVAFSENLMEAMKSQSNNN